MKYYSQYGQDAYLNEHIFNGKKNGVFIEIGADDGVTHSNTCFFEKELGWKGICIEPRKSAFNELKRNRNCYCENVAISSMSGKEKFIEIEGYSEQLSGLESVMDRRHKQRIVKEVTEYDQKSRIVSVECKTLNEILTKHHINHINYCSIDTEGSELQILAGIDFKQIKIDFLTVENNYGGTKIQNFLNRCGYKLIKRFRVDELYQLRNAADASSWIKSIQNKITQFYESLNERDDC